MSPATVNLNSIGCTYADAPACDPSIVSLHLGGISADRVVDNDDILLDFLDNADLDIQDTTCLDLCQDNDECFAFEETSFGECAFSL